jgi:hypothetical protein
LIFLLGAFCLAALVIAYGPSIMGPMIDDYINQSELDQSLAECHHDELRFQLFYEKHGEEGGTFNFTSRLLQGGLSNSGSQWSWGGKATGPVLSVQLGDGKALSEEDTQQIKTLLASLPPPIATASAASYRDQIHLAYYRDGQLHVYHYPKITAPPQISDLFKLLGVTKPS